MASPMRLDPQLVQQAELEGRLHKRSTPKQIEYWAELGKNLQHAIKPEDIVAITQGLVEVKLEPVVSYPVDPDDVFAAVERDRKQGQLAGRVTTAPVCYEASRSHPGLLDCIYADGRRETGQFYEGEFIART